MTAATLRPIFGQEIAVSGQEPYGDISTAGGIQVVVGADYTKERYATSTDGVYFRQAPVPCPTAWIASLGGVHGGRVQALCTSDPGMSKTGKLAQVAPALGKPFVQVGKPSDLGITQGYAVASGTNATIAATGRGFNYLYGTFDGGKTWKPTLTVSPDNPWFDLQFATTKVGAVVDEFPDLGSKLYRTADGGTSWHPLTVH